MGTLYQADCPCGFKQIDLLQGYGINQRDISYELYQCENCHMLVNYELSQQIDSLFKPVRCPECKEALIHLSGEADQHPHPCPECKQNTLILSVVGLWD